MTAKTCTLTVQIPAAPAGLAPNPAYRAQLSIDGKPYGSPRVVPVTVNIQIPRGEDSSIAVAWSGTGSNTPLVEASKRFACREEDYRLVTAALLVDRAILALTEDQRPLVSGAWSHVKDLAAVVDARVLARDTTDVPLRNLLAQLGAFQATWAKVQKTPPPNTPVTSNVAATPDAMALVSERVEEFHAAVVRLRQWVRTR